MPLVGQPFCKNNSSNNRSLAFFCRLEGGGGVIDFINGWPLNPLKEWLAKTWFLVTVSFQHFRNFYEQISFQRDSYSTSKTANVKTLPSDLGQGVNINRNFNFHFFVVPQKGVMKFIKAFINPFWSTAMSCENKTLC